MFGINSELCIACQKCCTGEGYVYISREEARHIAEFLKVETGYLLEEFCKVKDGWYLLKEKPGKECIFLEKEGCRIYPVRPKACRDFPEKWRYDNIEDFCPAFVK